VTGYGKTDHSRHFVETEINTHSERTFIADHNGGKFNVCREWSVFPQRVTYYIIHNPMADITVKFKINSNKFMFINLHPKTNPCIM